MWVQSTAFLGWGRGSPTPASRPRSAPRCRCRVGSPEHCRSTGERQDTVTSPMRSLSHTEHLVLTHSTALQPPHRGKPSLPQLPQPALRGEPLHGATLHLSALTR